MSIPNQGQPTAMQNENTLTLEQMNKLINNPKEHPQIRSQMEALRNELYPDYIEETQIVEPKRTVEDDIEEVKKTTKKKRQTKKTDKKNNIGEINKLSNINEKREEKVEIQIKKYKALDSINFENIINERLTGIPSKEIFLLSDDTPIHIRSMTVKEYKILAKRYSIFIDALDNLSPLELELEELELNNTLDSIIQNCVLESDFNVMNLTIYDWIYVLLWIRLISKGVDVNFGIYCKNEDCRDKGMFIIKREINEIINYLEENKSKFVKEHLSVINFDGINLTVNPLNRGDYRFIEIYKKKEPEISTNDLEYALSLKSIIQGDEAGVLNHEQRIQLFNILDYNSYIKISNEYIDYKRDLFKSFGEFKCDQCGEEYTLRFSDFIRFFYDI